MADIAKNTFGYEEKLKKKSLLDFIPSRLVVTLYSFFGLILLYGLRVNLSIAIVAMVNVTVSSNGSDEQLDCPLNNAEIDRENSSVTKTSLAHEGTFDWSPTTQGNILGAFYYGYMASQTIGGRLSELTSPKLLFAGGLFGSAVFTLLTPICARWNVAAMVVVRTFNGLFQGIVYPALYSMVSRWIPKHERSTILAACLCGGSVGAIISMPFTSYLCEYGFDGGWPSSFYILGVLGAVYCFLYVVFIYSNPQENPRISVQELSYIVKGTAEDNTGKKLALSWKKMLSSGPLWALTLARVCNTYTFHVVLTKLPSYLDNILHQSIEKNGLVNAMMYLSNAISMICSGSAADLIVRKGYLSHTATTKIFETIAQVGVGLCMIGIPLVGCDDSAVVALLVVMLGVMGLVSGSTLPLPAIISPEFSGTVCGISQTFAGATGFVAPLIAGAVLEADNGSIKHWSFVFYSSGVVSFMGAAIFFFFGSAEKQDWSDKTQLSSAESEDQKTRY